MRFLLFLLLLIASEANAFRSAPTAASTPPDITCPGNVTISTDPFTCTAVYSYTVTATDDQAGWVLSQTAGLASGSTFPVGTTVNQFKVVDVDGNSATCSFTVTVRDLVPPVAVCVDYTIVAIPTIDDPSDCYDGAVSTILASAFDDGSYDNCGLPLKITIRRTPPYSDCILALNPVNGHPDCNEAFPDFPSEFERAISEYDFIKIYCCEAGTSQNVIMRAYQLNADGSFALDTSNQPIFSDCMTTLEIQGGFCPDSTTSLAGKVMLDVDGDCQPDTPSAGLADQVIEAISANGDAVYTATSSTGTYTLQNLEGQQVINVLPSLPNWDFCNLPATVTIPSTPGLTTIHDIYAHPIVACPMLQISLSTTVVRPCAPSTWTGKYCNLGGGIAEDAYVDLVIPGDFEWQSASETNTIIGDTIRVQLGTVAPGECGYFHVTLQTPCNPAIIGRDLCMEAHIYPDDLCLPPASAWSGAQLQVSAECEGDSVRFVLRNTGLAATTQALDYVIIDDMVIMMEKSLPANLAPGDSRTETIAANGHAYRLNAHQEPGHPTIANPSVLVEYCNGTTVNSQLGDFVNEDGSFFTEFACREVVSSFDPNEKLAFPRGFSAPHYVEPNTTLTYQLGFQNTGNDTAFLVVLRDTLSPLLDPATLRMTGSSHPFTWSLNSAGQLEVEFQQILLPDSTTNEPASHGFVQFHIAQKADNPIGSVIENRAGIYFDVNAPVITNTVWHTVGHDFVQTSATENPANGRLSLSVYPNPATETAFLALDGRASVQVRLLNVLGKEVQRYAGKAPGIQLQRNGLPEGMYWIEVKENGRWQASGKLLWKD